MKRIHTPRPEWVDKAVVGSVIRSRSGDLRVIRGITSGPHQRQPIFSFAIRRCSWTRRAHTCYTWGELVRSGYTYAGVVVKLNSRLDKALGKDIRDCPCPPRLHCWDVVGGVVA